MVQIQPEAKKSNTMNLQTKFTKLWIVFVQSMLNDVANIGAVYIGFGGITWKLFLANDPPIILFSVGIVTEWAEVRNLLLLNFH